MANHYFRFKQFTVEQEHCAMKVCTDACLFGAWIAEKSCSVADNIHHVLDLGTGTGLLSLMLAQKSTAEIDAVEIDAAAAAQAEDNFQLSPWREQLHVVQGDIKVLPKQKNYDLIIANPPFFEHDLKSANAKRNLALHSEALSLEELLAAAQQHIHASGRLAVLLPYHRSSAFEALALQYDFYVEEKVLVKQTPKHTFFRTMFWLVKTHCSIIENEIVIKESNDSYSATFTALLNDYYLFETGS